MSKFNVISLTSIAKKKINPCAAVYILENPPPGGGYQRMTSGRKNMKREREKGGKCQRPEVGKSDDIKSVNNIFGSPVSA